MIDLTMSGTLPAGLKKRDFERAIRLAFVRTRHAARGSVALAFVSARRMRALNKSWRHKDRTTDVLSFSPAAVPSGGALKNWGDILVEPSFVRAEARRRGIPFAEEVLRVTVHGMLHLFGYDHATAPDELKMFTLQERIVAETL